MGCSFSCKRSSPSSKSKTIRIIHMNGHIEEIHYPVTVGEVTGKSPKHFLFTQAQLLAGAGSTPLKLDTPLQLGRVYFLLPFSLFDSNVSPVELAPLARKLASVAQASRSKAKSRKSSVSSSVGGSSPLWGSPATSPNRQFSDRVGPETGKDRASWKPILSTIREISFNRRESDLQENVKVDRT